MDTTNWNLDAVMRLRIAKDDKKLLEEAAKAKHMSLSTWARMVLLDKAVEQLTKKPASP